MRRLISRAQVKQLQPRLADIWAAGDVAVAAIRLKKNKTQLLHLVVLVFHLYTAMPDSTQALYSGALPAQTKHCLCTDS
jgi:hypothetical protein